MRIMINTWPDTRSKEVLEELSEIDDGYVSKEDQYQQALEHERLFDGNIAPDGCFFCGGDHSALDCPHEGAQSDYWDY